MPRTLPGVLHSTLLALTLSSAAAAQETPSELTCTFDHGTQRTSDDRAPRRADDEVRLTFTAIDTIGGVATIAAEDRSIGVAAVAAGHVISFLEIMPSGNVALTTVSTVDSEGAFPAVHSRHVFDSLRPGYIASQLYGSCVGRL